MKKQSKKQNSELTWRDVYKPPFHLMKYSSSWLNSSNGTQSITFNTDLVYDNKPFIDYIIAKLNGEKEIKSDIDRSKYVYGLDIGEIFVENESLKQKIGIIRGWGHLIGCGALNLDPDHAAKIQDSFAQWVIDTLNNHDDE